MGSPSRPRAPARTDGRRQTGATGSPAGDPLLAIAPAEYVQALTGQTSRRAGAQISCPFHSDRMLSDTLGGDGGGGQRHASVVMGDAWRGGRRQDGGDPVDLRAPSPKP